MIEGPDFIGIGLPKAGTGWLYDQLEAHPDFWMPPVKELAYLDQRNPSLEFVHLEGDEMPRHIERRVHREHLDHRDIGFLEHAKSCRGKARDLDLYAGFFRFKGERKSGDITPPYCNLAPPGIAAVAERFPHAKLILLVRDPVSRAWSRISMAHRNGRFNEGRLEDPDWFRNRLRNTRRTGGLYATEILARWRKAAPKMALGVYLFDDIAVEPDRIRESILDFLGADVKKCGTLAAGYNRKAEEKKLAMTEATKAVLVEHFADELRASPAAFGGRAAEWPGRYGL